MKHTRVLALHACARMQAIQERVRELRRINSELLERSQRNGEIGRHLVGLSQVRLSVLTPWARTRTHALTHPLQRSSLLTWPSSHGPLFARANFTVRAAFGCWRALLPKGPGRVGCGIHSSCGMCSAASTALGGAVEEGSVGPYGSFCLTELCIWEQGATASRCCIWHQA